MPRSWRHYHCPSEALSEDCDLPSIPNFATASPNAATNDCVAGSPSAQPISTPIRRIRSGCCASAASGHTAAPPPMTLMTSRRLIASPKPKERALYWLKPGLWKGPNDAGGYVRGQTRKDSGLSIILPLCLRYQTSRHSSCKWLGLGRGSLVNIRDSRASCKKEA